VSHWDDVYQSKAPDQVSWFLAHATMSLELVRRAGVAREGAIVDVGAGASRFADGLIDAGYTNITLLDLSDAALQATRARIGDRARYVTGDVTAWEPPRTYALWHDRAVFHFLVTPEARAAYRRVLVKALAPGGSAIVATFAEDGPEKCSGLPVQRYSAEALAAALPELETMESRRETHTTPWGAKQSFVYVLFRRRS
jgi:trans-aconitate methyltransferase